MKITDKMVTAAADANPYWLQTMSEDDNRYCSPPRTRAVTEAEENYAIRRMLENAFKTGESDLWKHFRKLAAEQLESDDCYYAVTDGKPGMFKTIQAAAKWLRRRQL